MHIYAGLEKSNKTLLAILIQPKNNFEEKKQHKNL